MYKVKIQELEEIKKHLLSVGMVLKPIDKKIIKKNEKLIKLLENEYYID